MDQLPDWAAVVLPIFIAVVIGFGLLEGSLRWWIRGMERSYAAQETNAAARPKRQAGALNLHSSSDDGFLDKRHLASKS